MKIVIYDDNLGDVTSLKKIIDMFFKTRAVHYEVDICENTTFLLHNLHQYDLIFLDIEINNENGIDIGKKIRQLNSDIRIIIVSSYAKYLIQGYAVQADRYFLKPIKQETFNIEFENVIQRYIKKYEGFFDEKIAKQKFYYQDILYIEFLNRKTRIHFINSKVLYTPYPLKYWEDKVREQNFAKPHKSFLINLMYLNAILKTDVLLINDELLPLSRHFKTAFEQLYVTYLQGGL